MRQLILSAVFLLLCVTSANSAIVIKKATAGPANCTPPGDIALIWNGAGICGTPPCDETDNPYNFDDVEEFPIAHTANIRYAGTGDRTTITSTTIIGTGAGITIANNRDVGTYFEMTADLVSDGIIASNEDICVFYILRGDGGGFPDQTVDYDDVSLTDNARYRHDASTSRMATANLTWNATAEDTTYSIAFYVNSMHTVSSGGSVPTSCTNSAEYCMVHWQDGVQMTSGGGDVNDSRVHQIFDPWLIFAGSNEFAVDEGVVVGAIDSVFISVGSMASCRCGDTDNCTNNDDTFQNQVVTLGKDLCSEW